MGDDLVWNQQFTIASYAGDRTVSGVTITRDGDKLIFFGTATANISIGNFIWWAREEYGHKYIVRNNLTDKIHWSNNIYSGISLNNINSIQNGGQKNSNYSNGQPMILNINSGTSFNQNGEILEINIFDLTLMFGSGNEPSTIDNFNTIIPNDRYYPFDPGLFYQPNILRRRMIIAANELPAGYEIARCITSITNGNSRTRGAYINPGIYMHTDCKIEAKWQNVNFANNCYLYGNDANLTYKYTAFLGDECYWRWGDSSLTLTTNDNNIHTSIHNKNGVVLDGVMHAYTTQTTSHDTNAPLFIGHNQSNSGSSGTTSYFKGNIFYIKVWDGSELIADFIPAGLYNNAGTSITQWGLYDKVLQQFYITDGPVATSFTGTL